MAVSFKFDDIRTRVVALLQDDRPFISTAERDEAINQAILEVTHDKPLELVADITGDATSDYDLEGLGFERGWSDVSLVEYPAGENPPLFKERNDDWIVYTDPSKAEGARERLRFLHLNPAVTETIRVTFTKPHLVTVSESTLNILTFTATVYKSLVLLYRALAARFAQTNDPTLAADAVDYGGRSQNFLFAAERYETNYKKVIGFGEQEIAAAQAMGEADVIFMHGEDMLFHPARQR